VSSVFLSKILNRI